MDQLAMPVTQQVFRSIIFVEASKRGITLLVVAEQTMPRNISYMLDYSTV